MRRLAVFAVFAVLVLASPGTAAADVRCYAGTMHEETTDGEKTTQPFVMTSELDRGASVIRRHRWVAHHADVEAMVTEHVSADGATYTIPGEGQGTLRGEPWHWTGSHSAYVHNGLSVESDETLTGDAMTADAKGTRHGKLERTLHADGKAFDCGELARRRAALDDTAPDAVRACYAGTETEYGGQVQPVVVQVITERARIRFVRVAADGNPALLAMAITGTAIALSNPDHAALQGSGTLTGAPGAWTGYAFSSSTPGGTVTTEGTGTLGGAHITRTLTFKTARASMANVIDADRFDCAQFAAKRP